VTQDLAAIERRRLRSLVEADIATAQALHHPDFQLVTPGARTLGKEEYLAAIASGALQYLTWDAEEMSVRVTRDAGCLRYVSTLRVRHDGQDFGPDRYWHTDYYELHDSQWQAVFSHATGPIREAGGA
jgi:hypothetical protein